MKEETREEERLDEREKKREDEERWGWKNDFFFLKKFQDPQTRQMI